jgi:hypothetical protein
VLRRRRWVAVLNILGSWFFRLLAIVSVGYLVYDRIYETESTISSPIPDAIHPFDFIFTITNNSHLFPIRDVQWFCVADHVKTTFNNTFANAALGDATVSGIRPGQNLNSNCNGKGTSVFLKFDPNDEIVEGTVRVKIEYDIKILGVYTSHRSPFPTRFTWITQGAKPQWVRGEFAK